MRSLLRRQSKRSSYDPEDTVVTVPELKDSIKEYIEDLLSQEEKDYEDIIRAVNDNTLYHEYYYNVKKYGARGDGVSDDTDAFHLAIDACPIGGSIYIPEGTYLINVTHDKVVYWKGAGMYATFLKSYTADGTIFNVTTADVTWLLQGMWEDMVIAGTGTWPYSTVDCVGIKMGDTSILTGRCLFNRVYFMGLDKAIQKLLGNIGNTFNNCVFQTCNYFMHAVSDAAMHAGTDYYNDKCHFGGSKKACFYYDSTSSSGGVVISDCIIEANAGFVFFVKNFYSGMEPGIVITDTHFEHNSNIDSTDIEIDGVTYTAAAGGTIVFGKFHNASRVRFNKCYLSELTLSSDNMTYRTRVFATNCTGDADFVVNKDNHSAYIPDFNSPDGINRYGPDAVSYAYGSNIKLSETFRRPVAFETGGSQWTTSVEDGVMFPICQVHGQGAQYKTYGDFSVTNEKWYFAQVYYKLVSGNPCAIQVRSADGVFTIQLGSVSSSEWISSSTIYQAPATKSNVYFWVNAPTGGGSSYIRFSGLQVLEFDTADEAEKFIRSKVFAISAQNSEVEWLSTTTVSFAANADTELFTVPTGMRCILDHAKVVVGSSAGATTTISIGQNGAETDFVPANTLSNLTAEYDMAIIRPIPNTTPLLSKSYAAETVIEARVGNQSGGATNTVYLYGTLY